MRDLRIICRSTAAMLAMYGAYAFSQGLLAKYSGVALPTLVSSAEAQISTRAPAERAERSGSASNEDLHCLALNVYWEARTEPWLGKLAVAMVTLNRVESRHFENTICAVVRQGGEKVKHRCQFSWYCDGKRDEPLNQAAWREAKEIARLALEYQASDPTDGALYFHADYVRPKWSKTMTKKTRIGRHLFYGIGRRQAAND